MANNFKAPNETKVIAETKADEKKSLQDPWSAAYPCPLGLCTEGVCRHFIAAHPATQECSVGDCAVCSIRDCPSHCSTHYDKDGCPLCDDDFVGVFEPPLAT